MRTLRQPRLEHASIFWILIALIFIVGTLFRVATIDRGTPTLGIAVYLMMLCFFFTMVAVPAGMMAGLLARFALRFAVTPRQLRRVCALLAAAVVVVAHGFGHRFPPWHVWLTTATITALLTLRTYRWGRLFVIAWQIDRNSIGTPSTPQRIHATHRVGHHVRE